ncbi:MAG: HD domain-containing protein [Acidimicrobiales bacterium]|nr:HD domain-containing protein [Acidimicrobiales bacterium]
MTDVVDLSAPNPNGFTAMADGTEEQWQHITTAINHYNEGFVGRIVDTLWELDEDAGGFAVTRLEHSLQSATRAYRDDKDTEYVVCALLHDIGDMLAPYNHDQYAAAVLRPFVSDANHWMIEHHGVFQGYYFFDYLGLDKNMRDQYLGHEHYDRCAEFCHNYDQNSFDPSYDSMSVEDFIPALQEVLGSGPRQSIYKAATP